MLEYENLEFYFDDPFYYSFHFFFCLLSGITLALIILALFLICINLALSQSWSLLVFCLIIAFSNFWLRGIIGNYTVDVLLNIGSLGLLLIITPSVSWSLSFVEIFSSSFMVFSVVLGVILSSRDLKKAQYFRTLTQLDQANLLDQEHFQEGTFEQRLIFDLNTRDAAIVIYHFFRDPRPWLYEMIGFAMNPMSVPTENSYDVYDKVLWLRHKTQVGPVIDIEVIRFIRVGRNKYLIKLEHDTKDWYLYAVQRYSDFSRAIYRSGSSSL